MSTVQEPSWKNTEIILAGRTLINAEEISFKVKLDVEVFTDNNGNPSGWGAGEKTGDGNLKVRGSEYNALVDFAVAYGYDLLDAPPMPLIIQEKSPDLPTLMHVLSAIKFVEDGFSGKVKDKNFVKDLPFKIVGPVYRAKT